jgi:hypothetical protein
MNTNLYIFPYPKRFFKKEGCRFMFFFQNG